MAALHVTEKNFEEEVLQSDIPVLVDFWATWCGPCQMMGPVIDELSEEVTNVKIVKLDVDKNPNVAKEYSVMSIPTLKLFKAGKVEKTNVGLISKVEILELIS